MRSATANHLKLRYTFARNIIYAPYSRQFSSFCPSCPFPFFVEVMWNGRTSRRSVPLHIIYYFYALLAIYLTLSTNNGLQSINSPIYIDGHASNTEKFLVAEFDGLLRVRLHDTLKRRGFMSPRINYFQNSTATFQQAKLITKETSRQILVPRMANFQQNSVFFDRKQIKNSNA